MKKYRVSIRHTPKNRSTTVSTVEIEANNTTDAKSRAFMMFVNVVSVTVKQLG